MVGGKRRCNQGWTRQDTPSRWPGTHLAFHTKERFPNDIGNLVYFDEYVGRRRLKFESVVTKNAPGRTIVWQMKKIVKLPVWLSLTLEDKGEGLAITHEIKAGFAGGGQAVRSIPEILFE